MKKLKTLLVLSITCMVMANGQAQQVGNGTLKDSPKSKTFLFEKSQKWESAGKGMVRQIMGYDGRVMLVKIRFEKGAVGTPHKHPHTQTTYIVSGKFEFTVDGVKKIVGPGDGVYMEPNVEHGCVCLEPGILIDCFSPMREDFLKK